MKKIVIIEKIKDVATFVGIANKINGEVRVERKNMATDGRSLMGIFAIDPTEAVCVTYPDGEYEMDNFLANFEVM